MDHYALHFGKILDNITIEDVVTYFNDIHKETNRVEFKSFNPGGSVEGKLKPILETICAFLNSEGGMLIWGAPQGRNLPNGAGKIFTGEPSFVDVFIDNDKLINKICDYISPLPVGIKVRTIGSSNKFIYLFQVHSSPIKPHQYDNKYLIRLDGQTRAAPHYYIESMFKQIKYPQLEGYIKPGDVLLFKDNLEFRFDTYVFNWSPMQNEKNVNIVLFSSQGIFKGWNEPFFNINRYHDYGLDGHLFLTRKLDDILFHGSPFTDTHSLILDYADIKEGKEVEMILRVGGESSPQKESDYKFRFERDDKNHVHANIVEMHENKLISDLGSEIGPSKDEIIRKTLGRR